MAGKFNRKLSIRVIRNKEAFFMHHILEYLNKVWDDYETDPILTHTFSLKRELLKKLKLN